MSKLLQLFKVVFYCSAFSLVTACANMQTTPQTAENNYNESDYAARLPAQMDTSGKKLVYVNPNVHAWGAYGEDGQLVRAGIATAGGRVCPPDADEADCRTNSGTFHITAEKGEDCASKQFPKPHGGGLMPYCMFFSNGQALHGSPDNIVVDNNISHGCVRMRIPDAEWMESNFAHVGTKVVVEPYES